MNAAHTLKKLLRRLGRAIPVTESAANATSVFEHIGSITKVFKASLSERAQRRAAARRARERERGGQQ